MNSKSIIKLNAAIKTTTTLNTIPIVLDVKTGNGAFMKTEKDAKELAHAMVRIGNHVGRKTIAIISDMSQPLGFAIGNALEVKEAIETLQGKGPQDLTDLVLTLGSQMVILARKAQTAKQARAMLKEAIDSGKAIAKFKEFLQNQGGDASIVDDTSKLPQAKYQIELPALKSGYVSRIIADEIGVASMMLGAGRATKEDTIDLAVGLVLHKKVGNKVTEGESLLTIYSNRTNIDEIKQKLYNNIFIENTAKTPQLIHEIITD